MSAWKIVESALLIIALAVILEVTPPLHQVGQGDFRSNWTASYLLTHRENMYDAALVWSVERNKISMDLSYPLITLSPPWVALILIPYALEPFVRAAWLWLVTNIFLVSVSAIVLWQSVASGRLNQKRWWIGLLAAFSFSITLTALVVGQTTIFVLAMVTAFLAFEKRGFDEWAGIAFAGMFVKPQMAFVTIFLLAFYIVRARRWRIAFGFIATALTAVLVLFLLRPAWPSEYWNALVALNALGWESSNLGGLLLVMTGWAGSKFIGFAILLPALWFWLRHSTRMDIRMLVDVSLLLSVITAPYGFSYDHVVLLAPLLSLLAWVTEGLLNRIESATIVFLLIVANGASYYERILSPSEVYFFWVPLVIAGLYFYAAWRVARRHATLGKDTASLTSFMGYQ